MWITRPQRNPPLVKPCRGHKVVNMELYIARTLLGGKSATIDLLSRSDTSRRRKSWPILVQALSYCKTQNDIFRTDNNLSFIIPQGTHCDVPFCLNVPEADYSHVKGFIFSNDELTRNCKRKYLFHNSHTRIVDNVNALSEAVLLWTVCIKQFICVCTYIRNHYHAFNATQGGYTRA